MGLTTATLETLRHLGVALPEHADALSATVLFSRVRWPAYDFETRPQSGLQYRRVSFELPSSHSGMGDGDWTRDAEPPYLQIGTADHFGLLLRTGDSAADPQVIFFDASDDDEPHRARLSALLSRLQIKESTRPKPAAAGLVQPSGALEQLLQGIERGAVQNVKQAIAEGADVNARFERRAIVGTPLTLALRGQCRPGTAKVVDALLAAGADAIHADVVDAILSRKAEGTDDFHAALGAVFARGCRIPSEHPELATPLEYAEPRSLESMFAHGLDVNTVFTHGELGAVGTVSTGPRMKISLLCEAIWHGEIANVEVLLRHGADPNYVSSPYDLTPLHFAVSLRAAKQVVKLLLEHGARPHRSRALPRDLLAYEGPSATVTDQGLTPREYAVRLGKREVAALIPET